MVVCNKMDESILLNSEELMDVYSLFDSYPLTFDEIKYFYLLSNKNVDEAIRKIQCELVKRLNDNS